MDALPPSLPNAGLPPPASAATAGLAILLAELSESLAQAVAKLPASTPLTALVAQVLPQPPASPGGPQLPGTLVQISTPDGSAQIRLPPQIAVTPGQTLEIQVTPPARLQQPQQPQQWRLLTVDDRPATPAGLAPAPVTVAAPSSTSAPSIAATVAMPIKPPPQGIPATLVTSSDPALPSGTTLLVRITGLTPPPQPTAVPTPTSAPVGGQMQVPAPATAPSARPVPPVPEETPTAETPQPAAPAAPPAPVVAPGAAQPAVAPPPPTQAPPPQEIDGQVLPNTDAGKPLVRTSIGLIALDTGPHSLPPDTAVTLQVVGKPMPPPVLAPPLPLSDDAPERGLPRHVAQLVQAAQDSPEGGGSLADQVRDKIPAPGPKLAAQLLSAIGASSQPDGLARFFGDGLTTALAHAAPQALEALSRHWEAASTPVHGPGDGEWRALMVPFMMGGEVGNLRLTVRQRQGKLAAVEREKGTRFLLDLDLSRLGPLQFDGLVKRQHKRFDLIIRSKEALSGEMRRDIEALFLGGLVNFGLEGSVSFRPDGRFVPAPRLTAGANGIIFA